MLLQDYARNGAPEEAFDLLDVTRRFGLGAEKRDVELVLACLLREGWYKESAELWSGIVENIPEESVEETGTTQPGLWAEAALKNDAELLRGFVIGVAEISGMEVVDLESWFAKSAGKEADKEKLEKESALAGLREAGRRAMDRLNALDPDGSQRILRARILLAAPDDPSEAVRLVIGAASAARALPDAELAEHAAVQGEVWAAIVASFARKGEFDHAREVINQAGPSEAAALDAANALVAGLSWAGQFEPALQFAHGLRQKLLLPDSETLLSVIRPFRKAQVVIDPEDPAEIREQATKDAGSVVRTFAALAFNPSYSNMIGRLAGHTSPDVPFNSSVEDAERKTEDQGTDMPLDLNHADWVGPLLLRSVAVSTRSADLVDETLLRLTQLGILQDSEKLGRAHVEALLVAGNPGRAARAMRKSWALKSVQPEVGRLGSVWLALKEAGRLEEAGELASWAKGVGSDALLAELEVVEKYFVEREGTSAENEVGEVVGKVEDK